MTISAPDFERTLTPLLARGETIYFFCSIDGSIMSLDQDGIKTDQGSIAGAFALPGFNWLVECLHEGRGGSRFARVSSIAMGGHVPVMDRAIPAGYEVKGIVPGDGNAWLMCQELEFGEFILLALGCDREIREKSSPGDTPLMVLEGQIVWQKGG